MKFSNAIAKAAHRVLNACSDHAPELCAGLGVTCMIAGVVVGCANTLKAAEVLVEAEEDMKTIEEAKNELPNKYTEEDAQQDKIVVYKKLAVGMLKAYGPVVLLEAAGAILIFKGTSISQKRIAGLSAAYEGLSAAFNKYRDRVRQDQGEDKDTEYMYGVKKGEEFRIKANEQKQLADNDTETVEGAVCKTIDNAGLSPYARFIEHIPGRRHVEKEDPYYMRNFIQGVQDSANSLLVIRGRLTLNEVYDMLGLEQSVAGTAVGWTYVPGGRNENGDNYISFGLQNEINRNLLGGSEATAWLDFNVDDRPLTATAYARRF